MMEDEEKEERKQKIPKIAKVKNKMPAPVQITSEQLLREAKERELELVPPPPRQKISDPEELADFRLRKRKSFEDNIRKNRSVMSNWIKYAQFEDSQNEIQRARSVWERALDVDHRNITLWLKYAEMEMKNRQVNHARNIWDRAVTILPRANQLWFKYTFMEETLKNIAGCRQVFERWMEWEPNEQAWHAYINFELRYKELNRARKVYERFVLVHPEVKNWIKYARFEQKQHYISSARRVYERAVEFFGEENLDEQLLLSFARFEEDQREHERARAIFRYALDHLDKAQCQEIYKRYTIHEKRFGDREAIEDVIVSKRRFQYEEAVKQNPLDYDSWFDYLRLLESDSGPEAVTDLYERAIANVPPSQEKRHWRRYVYLWINYALYAELEMKDPEKTDQVYKTVLDIIPHKAFTFAKLWLLYAQFKIRQHDLQYMRKILGTSIGKCPKDKLFRGYIELEMQLREFDRCRVLYSKWIEFGSENCTTWMKYAELEALLGDTDRARHIFRLAVRQPRLDMPELLWKAFIDFEVEQGEKSNARELYKELLSRTNHVKVWLSMAQFEIANYGDGEVHLDKVRNVYRDANAAFKEQGAREERRLVLREWLKCEIEYGDASSKAKVEALMPKSVKKRRKIQTEDGEDGGWEEYMDFIFPDEEAAQPNLRLLAMAKQWKQTAADSESEEESSEEEKPMKSVEKPESSRSSTSSSSSSSDSDSSSSSEDSD